ncbi:hypothetical protein [Mycobacterium sp. CnD-18-1]|uniref:hypothetical protein n=1 Tax=Mycobacterium sp. CnD-18-1 TaxID=2917744 RepID=UPI001EF1A8E7|nr:hypothetical protein [Mycobacterium sp. CnD-18-1]MCG7607070.1 hypothetical protein [Mycobacterium sp. CnD-18-1]
MKVWNGSAFIDPSFKVWNGSAYVSPKLYFWNGSSYDQLWPEPLTLVGVNSVLASSITLPAHQPGDLIIVIASQVGLSTVPTKPSAGGTVPAWVTIDTTSAAGGMHTARFVATASNHTSGTWGADAMAAVVLRGQNPSPIGGHAVSASISSTFTAPSITMTQTDGSSILLHIFTTSIRNGSAWPTPPTGYTSESSVGNTNAKAVQVLTKDVTTSDGSVAVAAGGGFSVWQATSMEILAA